jgi:hypothetical protein
MKINLNDIAKFKLTGHGKKVLIEWIRLGFAYGNYTGEIFKNKSLEEISQSFIRPIGKGYFETEIWQLMSIFGGSMYNGCEVPFENMIIETLEE